MKTIALILATSLYAAAGAHAQQIATSVTSTAAAPAVTAPAVPWEPRFSGDMPATSADAPDDASITDAAASMESGPPTSIVPDGYVADGRYSSALR